MTLILGTFWGIVSAWLLLVTVVSYFEISPHFGARGAVPLFGARVTFFTPEHNQQLDEYRRLRVAEGKSLIWWRVVRSFVLAFPFVMAFGVLFSLWSTR